VTQPDPTANSQLPWPSPALAATQPAACARASRQGHGRDAVRAKLLLARRSCPQPRAAPPQNPSMAGLAGPSVGHPPQPPAQAGSAAPAQGDRVTRLPPAQPFQPLNNSRRCRPRPQASCPAGEIAAEGKGNLGRRNRSRPWRVLGAVPLPAGQPVCLPCHGAGSRQRARPGACCCGGGRGAGAGGAEGPALSPPPCDHQERDLGPSVPAWWPQWGWGAGAGVPALSPPPCAPQERDVGLSVPARWPRWGWGMREQAVAGLGGPPPHHGPPATARRRKTHLYWV